MSRTLASKRRRRKHRRMLLVRKHRQQMHARNRKVREVTARLLGTRLPLRASDLRYDQKKIMARIRITQEAMETLNSGAFIRARDAGIAAMVKDIDLRSATAAYGITAEAGL